MCTQSSLELHYHLNDEINQIHRTSSRNNLKLNGEVSSNEMDSRLENVSIRTCRFIRVGPQIFLRISFPGQFPSRCVKDQIINTSSSFTELISFNSNFSRRTFRQTVDRLLLLFPFSFLSGTTQPRNNPAAFNK